MQKISTEFSTAPQTFVCLWNGHETTIPPRKENCLCLYKYCSKCVKVLLSFSYPLNSWSKWQDFKVNGKTRICWFYLSQRPYIRKTNKKVIWWARNKHMIKNAEFKILFFILIFQILKYSFDFISENMTQI